MAVILLRIVGGCLGLAVADLALKQTLLKSTSGEGVLADGMFFWSGGWMIVCFYYALGISLGFWLIIPLLNRMGRLLQLLSQRQINKQK